MNKRRAMSRCSPQTETSDVSLQHASGSGNLAHIHQPLEGHFNKFNLNIDKRLDAFYEPTLFDF